MPTRASPARVRSRSGRTSRAASPLLPGRARSASCPTVRTFHRHRGCAKTLPQRVEGRSSGWNAWASSSRGLIDRWPESRDKIRTVPAHTSPSAPSRLPVIIARHHCLPTRPHPPPSRFRQLDRFPLGKDRPGEPLGPPNRSATRSHSTQPDRTPLNRMTRRSWTCTARWSSIWARSRS